MSLIRFFLSKSFFSNSFRVFPRAFSSGASIPDVSAYNWCTVKSCDYPELSPALAKETISNSIKHWLAAGFRGAWFYMNVEDHWWLPILLGEGFEVYFANSRFILLAKWLSSEPNAIPTPPYTVLGVGGIVTNPIGEYLMVKERRGLYLGWKFPAGHVELGESISSAIEREILEETNVDAKFACILGFRQVTKDLFFDDIRNTLFICALQLRDESNFDIKPCDRELVDSRWLSRSDLLDSIDQDKLPEYVKTTFKLHDEWRNSKRKGFSLSDLSTRSRFIYF